MLEERGYVVRYDVDASNAIDVILFSHPEQIALSRRFGDVLIVDCTYNTNRFGLPMCVIVGVDNQNKTFISAIAFTRSEDTRHYSWIMGAIKDAVLGGGKSAYLYYLL